MSKQVSFDELYRHSSQYKIWSFTKEELVQKRETINKIGIKKVEERLKKTPEVESSLIEKVTANEELELISFHSRRIGQLAKYFNMPSQVRATAISFLKKFYLVKSVMEYHPKLVLLTCLFLAAKSENVFISINSFCKRIHKTPPEAILSLEFEILQSLQFTLLTHHPFRPLYGFFFDIQETLKDDISVKNLGKTYDSARQLIDEALISDACYYYTPPQIALACFKSVDSDLIIKYLEKKFKRPITVIKEEDENADEKKNIQETEEDNEESYPMYEEILRVINECQQTIQTAKNPTKEEATRIDRKVQYCINPELVLKRKRDGPAESDDISKRQRTDSDKTTQVTSTPGISSS